MCFIKSPKVNQAKEEIKEQAAVVRHEADASVTKSSDLEKKSGYEQNLRTAVAGIEEEPNTNKKTMLGE